jgi:hypothetical protein
MTTITIFGRTHKVYEHMSELKADYRFAKRFYNKKQFFKYFIGNYIVNDRDEGEEEDFYEPDEFRFHNALGRRVGFGGNGPDYTFEIVKVEDITPEEAEDDWVLSEGYGAESFFIKDDNGQVYYVYYDED